MGRGGAGEGGEAAAGAGLWGGRLPDTWQSVDAEMYAILAYLRRVVASREADEAGRKRGRIMSDCVAARQQAGTTASVGCMTT